jgi:hypothetical protein
MLTPEMRRVLSKNISNVQGKMANRIVKIIEKVNNKELFAEINEIDTKLISKILKKLFDRYIDEMDNLILEYDHQDTSMKNLIDISHAIERLNKGYINFIVDTADENLKVHIMEQLKPEEPIEEPVIEPVEPLPDPTEEVPPPLSQPLAEW